MDENLVTDVVILAEQVVIQSALGFPKILEEHGVTPDFFTLPHNKIICDLIQQQLKANAPVNKEIIYLTHKPVFLDFEFGQSFNDAWLARDRILNSNLGYYVGVLKEFRFGVAYKRLITKPPEGDSTAARLEGLIEASRELLVANVPPVKKTFDDDWIEVLEIASEAEEGVFPHSLKTHYPRLDEAIGEGILDDYLVILGADSGAGKTSFALNLIRNVAMYDKHCVLYMSFEMGRTRLMRWFMSACTSIPMSRFTDGTLTPADWTRVCSVRPDELFADALTIIETMPEVSNVIREIRSALKLNPNLRMVVIDHLHLMFWTGSSNPVETISYITRALKQLAMETGVPIVLLSQLKKPEAPVGGVAAQRRDPHVSDLKGSGSIITDADLIMILQIDGTARLNSGRRLLRSYVLKNRGGRADNTNYVALVHQPECCVITES